MTATWIFNLVKALTVPYAGAHLEFQSMDIKIWEAEEGGYAHDNIEPGSILDIIGSKIKVKCDGGSVWLTRHDFINLPHKGEYLL